MTHFRNGRVFAGGTPTRWASSLVTEGSRIGFVGGDEAADSWADGRHEIVDLAGRILLPGLIDGHTHTLPFGFALGQVSLVGASSFDEIRERLRAGRRAAPDARRLRGIGWRASSLGTAPTAELLDLAVADIPVYLDDADYHTCWLNSAAIRELGIDAATPDPPGGHVGRRPDGTPDGLVHEAAVHAIVRGFLRSVETDAERDAALERACDAYLAAGVTGVIDMALEETAYATMRRALARQGRLPLRVAAYWRTQRTGSAEADLAQLERAVRVRDEAEGPWLRTVGVKIIADGVIASRTAATSSAYADGSAAEPIWDAPSLEAMVVAADAAGLDVAVHAIGDRAVDIALDAIEQAIRRNPPRRRRPRLEHLELVAPGAFERMARLGVTASMQPVHAEPSEFGPWRDALGDARAERGFAWREVEEAGVPLVFGSDAPTAPYAPLRTLQIAATRLAGGVSGPPTPPASSRVTLDAAVRHLTSDAAASVGDAERGVLAPGRAADLTVLDARELTPDAVREARVLATVVDGAVVYDDGL